MPCNHTLFEFNKYPLPCPTPGCDNGVSVDYILPPTSHMGCLDLYVGCLDPYNYNQHPPIPQYLLHRVLTESGYVWDWIDYNKDGPYPI